MTEGCLRNTRRKGAYPNNAFLSRTLLRCADLSQTDPTGANLRQAFDFETMFHGANLNGCLCCYRAVTPDEGEYISSLA